MSEYRKGFTLIELLVVIAIIAILTSILFPVFEKAKDKARQATDQSNLKQIGLAGLQYLQDNNDTYYPSRWTCTAGTTTQGVCNQYDEIPAIDWPQGSGNTANVTMPNGESGAIDTTAGKQFYWMYVLYPYTKSFGIFSDPSSQDPYIGSSTINTGSELGAGGYGSGGENSYAHNVGWFSPGSSSGGADVAPAHEDTVDRPGGTVLVVDGSFYGAGPDSQNVFGQANYDGAANATLLSSDNNFLTQRGTATRYAGYFANVGNATFMNDTNNSAVTSNQSSIVSGYYSNLFGETGSFNFDNIAPNFQELLGRHEDEDDVLFADGHVAAIDGLALVEDMCYWVTNGQLSSDGAVNPSNHPCD